MRHPLTLFVFVLLSILGIIFLWTPFSKNSTLTLLVFFLGPIIAFSFIFIIANNLKRRSSLPLETPLVLRCPKCGTELTTDAEICPQCGTKLPPPNPQHK